MKFSKNKQGLTCSEIEKDKVDLIRAQEIAKALLGPDGRIYPIPFSFIKNDTLDTLNVVMQAMALYTFPTLELCEWLNEQIDDNPEYEPHSAIEICAGTGWIGRQLQIPTTDIKSQENPNVQDVMFKQLSVPILYTEDVEKLESSEAVKKYHPEIVIGSYVTSLKNIIKKDNRVRQKIGVPFMNGHMEFDTMDEIQKEMPVGSNVEWIARNCYKLILVCNLRTHYNQSYLSLPHKTLKFPWLVTRGDNTQSRILIFENKLWHD